MDDLSLYEGQEKETEANEIAKDPERLKSLAKILDYSAGASLYPNTADAFVNDLNEWCKPINLSGITVPTLIVHGNMDGDIPYSRAEQAFEQIQGSDFYRVDKGWHCLCFHPDWRNIYKYEVDFVKKTMNLKHL